MRTCPLGELGRVAEASDDHSAVPGVEIRRPRRGLRVRRGGRRRHRGFVRAAGAGYRGHMRTALRVAGVLLGVGLWAAGFAFVAGGGHVLGAILVLLGVVAVVASLVPDRGEGIVETVWTWLSQLP